VVSVSRRQLLQQLGLLAAGWAVACTPLRVLTHDYPTRFDDDPELRDAVLRALVATVIPDAQPGAPNLTRVFADRRLPFARYAGFFAADLSRRAAARFGGRPFSALALAERGTVIRDGLGADGTTHALYGSAIVLAELAFSAGIYDDREGCPLIGFDGRFAPRPLADLTYPDAPRFLPGGVTADGNYA
jgi:hypothetical protein